MKNESRKFSVLPLVTTGVMIALEIILERIIPIVNSGYLKINFAFLPMMIVAVLYGPIYCGAAWAITDLIGALLFPTATFFPGFTASQLIAGIIFGILYKTYESNGILPILLKSLAASALHIFLVSLALGTLWLSILFGNGYFALLPLRITGALINFGIEFTGIFAASLIMKKNKKSVYRFKYQQL